MTITKVEINILLREARQAEEENKELEDHLVKKGVLVPTTSLQDTRESNLKTFAGVLMPNVIKGATSAINTTVIEDVAKLPVGNRGIQLVIMTKNVARVINGRKFTGHALDQMQSTGI